MFFRQVGTSGSEAPRDALRAPCKLGTVREWSASQVLGHALAHQIRDGSVLAPSLLLQRARHTLGQLNLCPDHVVMLADLMA